jgi:hypothetical protein
MIKHDSALEASGTSLQGYIVTTRAKLINAFGKPNSYAEGDKVTLEWCLDFGGGVIATVYDWKRYELKTPQLNEEMTYHIGGLNQESVLMVKKALDEKKVTE